MATTILPKFETASDEIGFFKKSTTYKMNNPYHYHDACEVYLLLSGNVQFYIEQTCFSLVPNSLVLLNPNEMHRLQVMDNTPYERICVHMKVGYINSLSPMGFSLENCFFSRTYGQPNLRILSQEELQEFLTIYEGLKKSADPACFGRKIVQDAYSSLLLLFLNQQFQTSPVACNNTMPIYISNAMQYIEDHLNEPIVFSDLASQLHINENYLCTQFKQYTGLSLRSYLHNRRIQRAKTLLQQGANVTEACYNSGFNDYANFIRSFKKAVGVSPGKYQKEKT